MPVQPNYFKVTLVCIIFFIGFVVYPILLFIAMWKLDKLQKANPKKYKEFLDKTFGPETGKGFVQEFHDKHGCYPPSGGGGN